MSIQTEQNNINRVRKDLAELEKKNSQIRTKEASNFSKINQIQRNITKNISATMLNSKLRQIENLQKENAKLSEQAASISKKIADKTGELNRYVQRLTKEEERERKKISDSEKRREKEQLEFQRKLNQELEQQKKLVFELKNSNVSEKITEDNRTYDYFISHASEDKEDFVRPLAEQLQNLGVEVWYDEFTLKIGDSLRRSIDKGLSNAKFGIVILSSSFFKKNWTNYELDGMIAREMEGIKVILPIWHKITKTELLQFSPTLADKYAFNTSLMSVEEIAKELADFINK